MDTGREARALYQALLEAWNRRSAADMAALFSEDGRVVGFDGSAHLGRAGIESDLARIFASHPTPAFVGLVNDVRLLAPDVAMIDAAAGMVPAGEKDLNPALNAVQTVIAVRSDGAWRIALFHNTPAAYHGRPQVAERLTEELRHVLQSAGDRWLKGPARSAPSGGK